MTKSANTDPTFGATLKNHAAKLGDAPAVGYGDDVVSWAELDAHSDTRAAHLRSLGIQANELVAISLPNGAAHHIWSFAAWKAGATPCILPTKLPGSELSEILALARPRVTIRPSPEAISGTLVLAADCPIEATGSPPDDLAADDWKVIGSGGSTGKPKLIVDHGAARLSASIQRLIDFVEMPEGGVVMSPGPLYHNAGFLFSSLALFAGSRVVGLERFDAERCLASIDRDRVEWLFLVPTMMHRIWSLPREVRDRYDMSSLKRVVHMAAACPVWLKREWIAWLGPERIIEGYSGTEGPGTMISGMEWLAKPGSVGRIGQSGITVRYTDGEICPAGDVGEIFFPPNSTERFHYIGAEPKLDSAGRMSLGDMGYIDEDDYLYIADRRTDLIIRGGANVYPAEIESALIAHPDIGSAVVIGLPCDDLGHRVHALIEPKDGGAPSPVALDAFLRERLARYKCPESYEMVSEHLFSEAGKVRRTALREERLQWLREGKIFQLFLER